jgi:hypothetical protein
MIKEQTKLAKIRKEKEISRRYSTKKEHMKSLFQKFDWAHACTNVSTDDDIP